MEAYVYLNLVWGATRGAGMPQPYSGELVVLTVTHLPVISAPETVNAMTWSNGLAGMNPCEVAETAGRQFDAGDCPFCGERLSLVRSEPLAGGLLMWLRCEECGTTVERYRHQSPSASI
jgi:hypothetical protein